MDKISRIAAAALLASSIAYASPALAVDTTAEDFVIALSADFSQGNYTIIQAKLDELQRLRLEGILFDADEMITVEQLMLLLAAVQNGQQSGANVAATLLAYLQRYADARFVNGGIFSPTADLNVGTVPGSVFPAGSAG